MKKNIFIFLFVFIFGLGILGNINPISFAFTSSVDDSFMIRAYGDSIASGDKLSSHEDYINGVTKIADGCYPQVFSESYIDHFGGEIISKAVSGDETWQLLDILETDSQTDEFKDTEIVTLCIGANNVLGVALSNIQNYLLGSIDDTAYRALLQAGLDKFTEDWPTILEYFEGKKVVTMTVYNPYRYAIENFPNNALLSGFVTKFGTMLDISMEYLQEINDIIRASASEDVYVVDIWNLFEGFTNEEYSQYLNVDAASISFSLDMLSNTALLVQEFKEKCDPHPTYAGHERIAQEHLNVFKYFKLSSNDLNGIKHSKDKITLNLNSFETGNYTFKVNKKETGTTVIATSSTYPISIDSSLLDGKGKVFVEIYNNNTLVYTTNFLDYNISYNTHTISTADNLQEMKDATDEISFTISSKYSDNYTYKLIRKMGEVTQTIATNTSTTLTVTAENLFGKGYVYVEVYKNNQLVDTTNTLSFSIYSNNISISSSTALNGYFEADESFTIHISADESLGLNFKLYKKYSNSTTEIYSGTDTSIDFTANNFVGNGEIYAEVYKNTTLLKKTESINYSISLNNHSISTDDNLSGIKDKGETITIKVTSLSPTGYTYKLYKKVDKIEYELPSLNITAENITGKGILYVKVYKNSKHVATTNSLEFNIILNDFRLNSDVDISEAIFDENEKINLSINSNVIDESLSYKIYNKIGEEITLLSQEISVTLYAIDYPGEGSFYAEVYYNSSLLSTTDEISYNISINTHTISADDGALVGLKDINKNITIKVSSTYTGSYTYELYKVADNSETLLKESTGNITITAMDLMGKGSLYMAVYKNGEKVSTTNSLDYEITLNQFFITTSVDITEVILDSTDTIDIDIIGQNHTEYSFKIYKNGTYISTATSSSFTISAQVLKGSGQIYVDVYKNYSKVHSTNSLDYSITINEFNVSCSREKLTGYIGSNSVITFEVIANKTEGYLYKLNKRSSGSTTVLQEITTPIIEITANDINGAGWVYVEVYKGQTCVYRSTNISYSFSAINFVISTSVNLTSLKNDDQKVYININDTSIPTPIFMLYRIDNEIKTKLQTTSTGEFEIKASQLDGEGDLLVEVYSEGKKIAETNTLQFKYDSKNVGKEKTNSNLEKILIIGASALVVVIVVTAVVVWLIGSIKKKKMWKI